MTAPDDIVQNAQTGTGPCAGCPAHDATAGWCVNPGLSNRNGTIMFVTEEPSHSIDWDRFESWDGYNEEYIRKFRGWKGGRFIQQHYLRPFELTMDDVWIADSIKCRPEDTQKHALFNKDRAFDHCETYLSDEIAAVDPTLIVTLGAAAAERTLRALAVDATAAGRLKVTQDYGRAPFETDWPVVISLHWAQRTLKQAAFLPVVRQAMHEILMETHQ